MFLIAKLENWVDELKILTCDGEKRLSFLSNSLHIKNY